MNYLERPEIVSVADLRPNMYVMGLGPPGSFHPLLRNRFLVGSSRDVRRLVAAGISQVWVDPSRTEGREGPSPDASCVALSCPPSGFGAEPSSRPEPKTSLGTEIRSAWATLDRVRRVTRHLAREPVQSEDLRSLLCALVKSGQRNPDALLLAAGVLWDDEQALWEPARASALMVAWQVARCASSEESIEAGLQILLQPVSAIAVHLAVPAGRDPPPDNRFADVEGALMNGMSKARRAAGRPHAPSPNTAVYHDSHDADRGRLSGNCGPKSPASVQMAHIIEVYCELTSQRDLCPACAPTEALAKLVRMADCEFDAALIGSFVRTIGPYPLGSVVRLGSGKLGWVIGRGPGAGLNPRVRVFFDARSRERVAPCDLSLDTTASACNGDSIVAYESPTRWQPRLRDFM